MNDDDERRAGYLRLAMVAPADRPPLVAPLDEPVGFEDAADRPDLARRLHRVLAFDFAHLPEIADLWVESWARTLPAIDFEARRVWFCTHVDEALRKGAKIRVALVETGDVVGFVLIDPATGYLDQIAVHPDLWGEGIAEALLDAARALSPARIRLDVNTDNPRAVAFYLREGFREIGRGVNPRSGLATIALEWRPG